VNLGIIILSSEAKNMTNNITLKTPKTIYSVGDYSIEDDWDNGPVPGVNFSQTVTANTDSLQNNVYMSWSYPDTQSPTGAYGWTAMMYGFNHPAQEIGSLKSIKVSYSLSMNDQADSFQPGINIIISSSPTFSTPIICEVMVKLLHDQSHGIYYSVGTITGQQSINIENVPADNLNNVSGVIIYPEQNSLSGTIDLANVIDPLVAYGLISANDYFPGITLGCEVYKGSGSCIVNSFSVTETVGSADFSLPALQAVSAFNGGYLSRAVEILDSAANIALNLTELDSLAAAHLISSIMLTDSGTPTLTVSSSELSSTVSALDAITGIYSVTVNNLNDTNSAIIFGHSGSTIFYENQKLLGKNDLFYGVVEAIKLFIQLNQIIFQLPIPIQFGTKKIKQTI